MNEGEPQVEYKEAITKSAEHREVYKKQSGGRGKFADIIFEMGPADEDFEGTGLQFSNVIKGGYIPNEYVPSVQKGFEIIRDAIQKVADATKSRVKGVDMDTIARSYITDNGYPEYPHGLGHQVGKTVHDGVAGMFPAWERYGNAPFMELEDGQINLFECYRL